jgi:hypothetical protein
LNGKKFPAELLQNTRNVLPLPTLLHEVATDEYRKPAPDGSGRTLYRWLQTQPYEVQREIGLNILRKLGILKYTVPECPPESAMEIDESIVLLGEELDAWWEEFSPMLDSEDRGAQAETLLRGFEIAKRFDSFKTQGLAAVKALLDRQDTTEHAGLASQIQAFAFAAKLANTLHDQFRDIDGETQVARLTEAIVKALERTATGRAALAERGTCSTPRAERTSFRCLRAA